MIKGLRYVKINSVNSLYFIIDEINEYCEESNGNKYLALVPTDGSKNTLKIYEQLWNKFIDLIRSITNNSDNYDQKYTKIKLNSDDDLTLKKMLELCNMIIAFKAVFS